MSPEPTTDWRLPAAAGKILSMPGLPFQCQPLKMRLEQKALSLYQ
jgi:hypothetical protein